MLRTAPNADPAPVEVMIGGRAQLHAAADAAAQQTSLEDVWAGRAPSQRVTRACGLCGHFQPVSIPFLRRSCGHCAATWMPARCGTCGSTVIAAVREDDARFRGTCTCGGELVGLAGIPRQHVPRTPADVVAQAEHRRAARRRLHLQVQLVGIVVAVLAGVGLFALLKAEQDPAGSAPASTARPVATAPRPAADTAAGKGAAARDAMTQSGTIVTIFACEAAYDHDFGHTGAAPTGGDDANAAPPTMGAAERAYVDACLAS